MDINFIYTIKCENSSSKNKFGLCDDPPPAKKPAYIDENNQDKWIATVINNNNKIICFIAIDHCIKIKRNNGDDTRKCDCALFYEDTIIFIELKSGKKGKWIKDAKDQLKETIDFFEGKGFIQAYRHKKAYICNRKVNTKTQNKMKRFFKETGYSLKIKKNIIV